MGYLNKRRRHLRDAREAKRQRRLDEAHNDHSTDVLHEAHWEGLSESEESDVEISEPEDNISDERNDAFERLLGAAKEWNDGADATKFPYQRGPTKCERQRRRDRAAERDLADAAKTYSQPISQFFSTTPPIPNRVSIPTSELQYSQRRKAIDDLEKKQKILAGLRARKHERPGLIDLWEEATRVLPSHSWVTELRLMEIGGNQEQQLVLTGFSATATQLVGMIDRSPLFADVALTAPIALDPIEGRERFALQAKIKKPGLQREASR